MASETENDRLKDLGFEIQDPQRFAQNMSRLMEETGKAVAAWMQPRLSGERPLASPEDGPDDADFAKVQQAWLTQPHKLMQAYGELWSSHLQLWNATVQRMFGRQHERPTRSRRTGRKDARFKDPAWSEGVFDYMKQSYLITSNWSEKLVEEAEGLDPDTKHKAAFFTKQMVNALAPSNWVFSNPELLRETFAADGENLVRGMQFLAEDIRKGGGDLKIRQTDPSHFKLGENIAATPGKVVFQNELFQLIQYEATTERVFKRPLMIVPPWINKFYILDLTPEKSMVKWAVEQGHTVFMISWVNPDEKLAGKTFEDYMREGVLTALDKVCEATGEPKVNAIGYCVGGTLLSAALAYTWRPRRTGASAARPISPPRSTSAMPAISGCSPTRPRSPRWSARWPSVAISTARRWPRCST
jgi:polyhydroxyalkanoate synthase subunit PhaC